MVAQPLATMLLASEALSTMAVITTAYSGLVAVQHQHNGLFLTVILSLGEKPKPH